MRGSRLAGLGDHEPVKQRRPGSADGKELRDNVLKIWKKSRLNFKELSEIGHAASRSNGQGLETFITKPGTKGNNCSRKTSSALKVRRKDLKAELTYIKCPIFNANRNKRVVVDMPMRLPTNCIKSIIEENPGSSLTRDQPVDAYAVPSFLGHPLVKEHGATNVLPLRMYSDKVKLNRYDTFYGLGIRGLVGRFGSSSRRGSVIAVATDDVRSMP